MSGEAKKIGKTQLALAVARGVPIAKWARKSGVPVATAFRWAREPDVRKAVEAYRRRTIDEAVGQMTSHFTKAAEIIYKTSIDGDTASLRFKAARAIFSDMITISKYSGLEYRMTELEQGRERERAAGPGTNPWGQANNYGRGAAKAPAVPPISPGGTGAG